MTGSAAESAFAEFAAAAYPHLVRIGFVLTGDRGIAEDLVQTALVQTYARWDHIAPGAGLAYTRVTMVRQAGRWGRRRWRGEIPSSEAMPDWGTSTSEAQSVARLDAVAALARLPWQQRAALALRFLEDLSEAQTAEILGCSVGTVKSRVSRGLAALRDDAAVEQNRVASPRRSSAVDDATGVACV